MVVQRPFAHEAHPHWNNPIEDELRVFWASEILFEKGIGGPDLLQEGLLGDHLGGSGEADLIVILSQIGELVQLGGICILSGVFELAVKRGERENYLRPIIVNRVYIGMTNVSVT